MGMKELFRVLGLRCTFVGSGMTGMVMLPVELVLDTPALPRLLFFFSIK
jgi:hypothetical protein